MSDFDPADLGKHYWPGNCGCGHAWVEHDVEEHAGDGSEMCCHDGCDQSGCPGVIRAADVMAGPGWPMARCEGHDERAVVEVPGRLTLGAFFVCLCCDMIPAEGHPVRELGWARAQYIERTFGGESGA